MIIQSKLNHHSAAHELETLLVLAQDVVATVWTVVGLVQAGLHQERDAAQQRSNAAADRSAPEVGCVAGLLIHYCYHVLFAAWTSHPGWVVVCLSA